MLWFMSRCHNKDILMSCCIQIVIIVRKTLNESHKHAYTLLHIQDVKMSCHGYEGVMLVLCTPLQVKCNRLTLHLPIHYPSNYFIVVVHFK